MDAVGATFSSLKIKNKEVPAGRGLKFTYVPKVYKLSSPVVIEKLSNELNIGETKI